MEARDDGLAHSRGIRDSFAERANEICDQRYLVKAGRGDSELGAVRGVGGQVEAIEVAGLLNGAERLGSSRGRDA